MEYTCKYQKKCFCFNLSKLLVNGKLKILCMMLFIIIKQNKSKQNKYNKILPKHVSLQCQEVFEVLLSNMFFETGSHQLAQDVLELTIILLLLGLQGCASMLLDRFWFVKEYYYLKKHEFEKIETVNVVEDYSFITWYKD